MSSGMLTDKEVNIVNHFKKFFLEAKYTFDVGFVREVDRFVYMSESASLFHRALHESGINTILGIKIRWV